MLVRVPFSVMGSPCELQLHAESESEARGVADQVISDLDRLEAKYSRYRPDSVTSRINRMAGREALRLDDETAGLLDYAHTAHAQSGGLFDITSGVLRRVWDLKSGRIPDQSEIDAILKCVGWQEVEWSRPFFRLPRRGMEIDFGGCVKEYAADRAASLCRIQGIESGLVDLGGDLCVIGPHPDGSPWQIGVRDPRAPSRAIATVPLHRGAIASSGSYERFMLVEGRRYCHILDPRTGWPVEGFAGVSVVAGQCLIAGTASTVAMSAGREGGLRWLQQLGLPHLCVDDEGALSGTIRWWPPRARPEPASATRRRARSPSAGS